ncbi:hypothetical protein EVAR_62579_1 [Eumeta japonica]|uniref:Uncharacterized protein n=1 Tax=Eumeta variegata TaxID=151549 RepID=A0A4C1Y748_EUMVA|nr:hypothetical protein EVAR_62579_1 [Eumeta japonica]
MNARELLVPLRSSTYGPAGKLGSGAALRAQVLRIVRLALEARSNGADAHESLLTPVDGPKLTSRRAPRAGDKQACELPEIIVKKSLPLVSKRNPIGVTERYQPLE